MTGEPLSSEDLSHVLRRAQEIDAGDASGSHMEAYIQAAEEAGISREATVQALRERLGYPLASAQLGEFVFARSADGHFYAAKVDTINEGSAKVRFTNGAIADLPLADLREMALMPGLKVNYLSPSGGYWANGTVGAFNRDSLTVTVESWGVSETISLDKVRLLAQTTRGRLEASASLWALRISWLLGGVGIGFLIDRLIR